MSEKRNSDYVKAVVDIYKAKMVIDSKWHIDEKKLLLKNGSLQKDLWGIRLFPLNYNKEIFIEFNSMTNIRSFQDNRSRIVENIDIQHQIRLIVNQLVIDD